MINRLSKFIANEEAEIGFAVSASFFMASSHCFASVGIDGLCHFEPKRERLKQVITEVDVIAATAARKHGDGEGIKHIVFIAIDAVVVRVGMEHLQADIAAQRKISVAVGDVLSKLITESEIIASLFRKIALHACLETKVARLVEKLATGRSLVERNNQLRACIIRDIQ